jgi:NTE family protein
LLPTNLGRLLTDAYSKHLFRGKTLGDLPDERLGVAPRFLFNATNVQSGALFRFSKPFVGDYLIGRSRHPGLRLALAIAASSAMPPILSPVRFDWDGPPFQAASGEEQRDLNRPPYTASLVLTDGGVSDNMAIETAWKQYRTVLVSDGAIRVSPDESPRMDWASHSLRVTDLIDHSLRALRKRQLIQSYVDGTRRGAYWSVGTDVAHYGLADPLEAPFERTRALAAVKTRLKAMDDATQERLINWGYAACDAGMRRHVDPDLPKGRFPFPRGV